MSTRFKTSPFWLLFLAAFAFYAYAPRAHAESEDEREAKEAEEESKNDDFLKEVSVKGRVTLAPLEDGKIPTVVGTIVSKDGKSYFLKLKDPKIQREKIVKAGNREVLLIGFLRNKEKYLVVSTVDPQPAVPPPPQEGLSHRVSRFHSFKVSGWSAILTLNHETMKP